MEAEQCYNQYEYYLVINVLRIYDSATGEFVWECDDLDHTSTVMVDTPSVIHSKIPPLLALRNQSGFYLLRVSSIAITTDDSLYTSALESVENKYLALTC